MNKKKLIEKKDIFPVIIMSFFFIIIYFLSIFLTEIYENAGIQAFENPDNPFNIAYIFIIMMFFTILILLISKFWKKRLIQIIILGAIGYTAAYIFFPLFNLIFSEIISLLISIILAITLVFTLFDYPEWYIIDICGIIIGTGAIIIFGISIGVLSVIILLIILSIYDAISVYKTKHMIDLADTVMDLKLPVLLVIPKIKKYSLINETKSLKAKINNNEERKAFFMGLGDVVMPGILVVATYYSPELNILITLSVILGTLFGFFILMVYVLKGKPQAGLPCLCGGAILGYTISSYLLYGQLIGLSFNI